MSFLTRLAPTTRTRTAALTSTYRLSTPLTRTYASRPVESTKSTLKKADRVVSDAAVKGIETGEAAASKIKQSVGSTTGEAEAKAGELKGDAAELAGKGKGKAKEVAGEARGKAEELKGDVKSKI
ncbi:hypothetical protein BJY04DRAFT_216956 [Aspergillus karnatakaensis]|uniref:uncharacterized protein n=1 Tax=Aspergillus karnatakaensis TaxID=1810916 RepID=UPI003CCCD6EC